MARVGLSISLFGVVGVLAGGGALHAQDVVRCQFDRERLSFDGSPRELGALPAAPCRARRGDRIDPSGASPAELDRWLNRPSRKGQRRCDR